MRAELLKGCRTCPRMTGKRPRSPGILPECGGGESEVAPSSSQQAPSPELNLACDRLTVPFTWVLAHMGELSEQHLTAMSESQAAPHNWLWAAAGRARLLCTGETRQAGQQLTNTSEKDLPLSAQWGRQAVPSTQGCMSRSLTTQVHESGAEALWYSPHPQDGGQLAGGAWDRPNVSITHTLTTDILIPKNQELLAASYE